MTGQGGRRGEKGLASMRRWKRRTEPGAGDRGQRGLSASGLTRTGAPGMAGKTVSPGFRASWRQSRPRSAFADSMAAMSPTAAAAARRAWMKM